MIQYVIVPGLGNSGSQHWQSLWEEMLSPVRRVIQGDWDRPDGDKWVQGLEETVSGLDLSQTILIGHSLGCITIVHWAAKYHPIVKGAMLVAPADIAGTAQNFPGTGFTPIPLQKLPFPSLLVASDNDPWLSVEKSELFARSWGSTLKRIGEAGHINGDAGYGKWPQGLDLLKKLE
ncbi:RBBP9/YdeN family alpha/beta hydrolase [Olivibacter sitiensis]|uniref:RBBP9/YdeN family alpha/beta hydrolase n=1 Tax=Olivibacter sitiensis TaxID=376470 RepID=UPI00042341C0|nr:alpha/beta fold hydrolase [Olivibacter sitiensis]